MSDGITPEMRQRRLDKIKKCMALSASPNPHEAAAALRQAQKMMQQLGVSAEDVLAADVTETVVKTREGYGNCRYMGLLAGTIDRAFGVTSFFRRNPGTADRLNVVYVGPANRVKLAEYCHAVIARALAHSWERHLALHPYLKQSGARSSFYMGWLWAVRDKVAAVAPTEQESAAFDRYIALTTGGLTEFMGRQSMALDEDALAEGAQAARDFSLSVPVEAEANKLEYAR